MLRRNESRLATRALPLAASALILCAPAAHAHIIPGDAAGGFSHGFAHPIGGLDHTLTMIAVGLWAAQLGKRAVWAVPLTFVSVMAIGGLLGAAGVPVPMVEQGILLSVLALGVLVTAAVRLPLAASAAIVGLFALLHGHAHGAEMPHTASGLNYGAGFLLATALLHGAGLAAGLLANRLTGSSTTGAAAPKSPAILRWAGAVVLIGGIYLCLHGQG